MVLVMTDVVCQVDGTQGCPEHWESITAGCVRGRGCPGRGSHELQQTE